MDWKRVIRELGKAAVRNAQEAARLEREAAGDESQRQLAVAHLAAAQSNLDMVAAIEAGLRGAKSGANGLD